MYIKKSVLVICSIVLIVATAFVSLAAVNPFGIENIDDFIRFSCVSKLINYMYYEDMNMEEAANTAIAGVAASTGDPYTNYMWGDIAEQYLEQVDGNYCGVGLYIEYDMEQNLISVVSAIAGSPAEAAGITTGDKILKLDGEIYLGSQLSEAASYMKGEEGTDVVLTILSAADGAEHDITLTRSRIEIPSVTGKMLDSKIGYISLSQFTEGVSEKFRKQYKELQSQADGMIIDLRNNPGGLLEEATAIASLFVEKDEIITYTQDKNGEKTEYVSSGEDSVNTEIPIVILTNGGSASASEVLTGALKDYGLATQLGEKTFGKGIVQSVFGFGEGVISVTTSRYYTPLGVCIHGEGLMPDISVEMDSGKSARISSLDISDDEQMLAAIEYLKK